MVDTLLTLAGPFLVQQGLNQGVQEHVQSAVWIASALYLVVTLVDWAVTWGYMRYTGRTAERLLYALRIRIFAHLQRLALDFYDRELSGRIMTRMTTDVDAFAQLLQTGLVTALVSILSFVGVLVVLAVLSWPLTLGVLVLVPPLLIATVWFRRRSARAYAQAREAISTVNAEFQENISGVRESQAYVREERNIDDFDADRVDVPRRPRPHAVPPGALLPVRALPRRVRRCDRARPRQRARAQRHPRRRHRDRVPAVPRPVLLPDPAALAGVRPVATGRRVDGEDQRADARHR